MHLFRTDECGRVFVYRPDGTRFQPQHIQVKDASGRKTVPVWGFFYSYGRGDLIQIDGRLTAVQYRELLEVVLLPIVRNNFPGAVVHFIQDNSSIHRARMVIEWFQNHPEIELVPWPSKSPDLNPIENIWGDIIKDMEFFRSRNQDEVFDKVKSIWDGYARRPQYWRKLAHSMPTRLQRVIQANGRWTKY